MPQEGDFVKVGMIIPLNTRIAPYISNYISYFRNKNIPYKTIVWDKLGREDAADYTFKFRAKDSNKLLIFIGYIFFLLKCRRIIKRENIDHLIVFTIAPMFFLGTFFLARFKGNFIADIRDDSPFRRKFPNTLRKIGDLSYTTIVSSPKYAAWFNKSVLCHNAEIKTVEEALDYIPQSVKSDVLRIVCAGTMMEENKNIEIISALRNNDRVKLSYFGRENEAKRKIERYVNENGVLNVEFQGEYRKDQIVDIYREQADLVNILRAKSEVNAEALPNKLYDATVAGIPIVVFSHNQAIVDYANKYTLGLILEDTPDISEELFRRYQDFSFSKYVEGRDKFLRMLLSDMAQFEKELGGFVKIGINSNDQN